MKTFTPFLGAAKKHPKCDHGMSLRDVRAVDEVLGLAVHGGLRMFRPQHFAPSVSSPVVHP